jgi:hypothetical protein
MAFFRGRSDSPGRVAPRVAQRTEVEGLDSTRGGDQGQTSAVTALPKRSIVAGVGWSHVAHASWILIGWGTLGECLISTTMIADVGTSDELATDHRREGIYGAVFALSDPAAFPPAWVRCPPDGAESAARGTF